MAGDVGRKITLTWNAVQMKGVREKSLTLNSEPVDLTSGEDNGWRTLDDEAGQLECNVTVSGVLKDEAIRADWHAGNRTRAVVITHHNGATLSGNFYLANFKETGNYKDAVTFEATLQSTGSLTYVAGA